MARLPSALPAGLALLPLFPLLLLGATGCTDGREGAVAPAAVPAVPVDDHAPGDGDGDGDGDGPGDGSGSARRTEAHVGDAVRVHGRELGRHLRAVLNAYVDPAVSVDRRYGPPAGKRWVAAGMSFVNVGGATYGSLGRMWAHDSAGRRHPPVPAGGLGELTTGKPLVFDSPAAGDRAEGWVVFEIPENARIVRLQYEDANIRPKSGEGFWAV
ncbi:hypothetical protein [Streptomyces sp. NPDC089799]|uniref:hypothetical protein n=1 Tax=Streptomyces sp. NPDC089799 TaxID=3155066 RepID=UPI0034200D23